MNNWAGNVAFGATDVHRPSSITELQRLVAGSDRIRALGTGHSFSRVADCPGDLVLLSGLPHTMDIDTASSSVTVAAGVRYEELATHLHDAGFALRTMASLPHISVAGACATGTHGSGVTNGNLATAVCALEMVTAGGEIIEMSRAADGDLYDGAVVALGSLGIVTTLTLDLVPTFDVRQYVYDNLPREVLDEHLTDILASGYSVSLFTDWADDRINQVWLKRRVDEHDSRTPEKTWMGARLADGPRHPVRGMPAANCTEQLGVPGPWHERLPHFRPDFMPSSGDELQTEYIVPRDRAVEALAAIDTIRHRVHPVLQVSEIRTIAPDDLWMSPSYRRDGVAIHFTWINDARAVTPVLAALEQQLAPYRARPHWGKLFTTPPEVVSGLYERWSDFVRLRSRYDPTGTFANEFMDTYFGSEGARRR